MNFGSMLFIKSTPGLRQRNLIWNQLNPPPINKRQIIFSSSFRQQNEREKKCPAHTLIVHTLSYMDTHTHTFTHSHAHAHTHTHTLTYAAKIE